MVSRYNCNIFASYLNFPIQDSQLINIFPPFLCILAKTEIVLIRNANDLERIFPCVEKYFGAVGQNRSLCIATLHQLIFVGREEFDPTKWQEIPIWFSADKSWKFLKNAIKVMLIVWNASRKTPNLVILTTRSIFIVRILNL